MLTVKLKGGMGNQMFQYATAKALAEKHNTGIILDTSYFDFLPKGDTPRHFQLDLFNIPKYNITSKNKPLLFFLEKILNKIFTDQQYFKITDFFLRFGLNRKLNGYFQNEKYFIQIRSTLLKEFAIKKELSAKAKELEKILEGTESVCLNIRRGDYLRSDYIKLYGLCDIDYYKKSLEYIFKKTSNPIVCIFSDDPEWVRKNLNIENSIYAGTDILKDYEQMHLMSKCSHNIIANSTFSWWGAWLNQNPSKIVIAPRKWLNTDISKQPDIVPKTWIRI